MAVNDIMKTTDRDQPLRPGERIKSVDILRGAALFGVILVNIFCFNVPDAYQYNYYMQSGGAINISIYKIINRLLLDKFYPIFSFLFGLGLFIQFARSMKKGMNAQALITRRMLVLLAFGVLHNIFVWEGDILFVYAVFGLTILLFNNMPPKFFLVTGIIVYLIPFLFSTVNILFRIEPVTIELFNSFKEYVAFYTSAPYWSIAQERLIIIFSRFTTHINTQPYQFNRLAYILLGSFAGRAYLVETFPARKKYWFKVWLFSLLVFLTYRIVHSVWMVELVETGRPLWHILDDLLRCISDFAQVCTYITGILLLLTFSNIQTILKPMANMGRMAMTVYLSHTIIFSFIFYSFGLGLYGQLTSTQLVVIAVALFIGEIIFSNTWLKYFQYGPFEWVWRSLTYKTILPLRLIEKVPATPL